LYGSIPNVPLYYAPIGPIWIIGRIDKWINRPSSNAKEPVFDLLK